jgi:hypothetical protein
MSGISWHFIQEKLKHLFIKEFQAILTFTDKISKHYVELSFGNIFWLCM